MNRIALLTLLAVSFWYSIQGHRILKAAAPNKPNIIFILADDKY